MKTSEVLKRKDEENALPYLVSGQKRLTEIR